MTDEVTDVTQLPYRCPQCYKSHQVKDFASLNALKHHLQMQHSHRFACFYLLCLRLFVKILKPAEQKPHSLALDQKTNCMKKTFGGNPEQQQWSDNFDFPPKKCTLLERGKLVTGVSGQEETKASTCPRECIFQKRLFRLERSASKKYRHPSAPLDVLMVESCIPMSDSPLSGSFWQNHCWHWNVLSCSLLSRHSCSVPPANTAGQLVCHPI